MYNFPSRSHVNQTTPMGRNLGPTSIKKQLNDGLGLADISTQINVLGVLHSQLISEAYMPMDKVKKQAGIYQHKKTRSSQRNISREVRLIFNTRKRTITVGITKM